MRGNNSLSWPRIKNYERLSERERETEWKEKKIHSYPSSAWKNMRKYLSETISLQVNAHLIYCEKKSMHVINIIIAVQRVVRGAREWMRENVKSHRQGYNGIIHRTMRRERKKMGTDVTDERQREFCKADVRRASKRFMPAKAELFTTIWERTIAENVIYSWPRRTSTHDVHWNTNEAAWFMCK